MDKPTPKPENTDYVVGYKRPPSANQFQPGQSGNRKGRPKGSQNFSTVIEKELKSLVTVTENGKRKLVPKNAVIIKQLVNKAAGGDIKATSLLLNETRGQDSAASRGLSLAPAPMAQEDEVVMRNILGRLGRHAAALETPTAPVATDGGEQ